MRFFLITGVFGIPLLILTLLILGLTIRAALAAGRKTAVNTFAILFWGFTAAVLGFLGQCSGLYNALTAISQATEIDPKIVSMGMAESFSTTLWGTGLLLFSAVVWFVLRGMGAKPDAGAS